MQALILFLLIQLPALASDALPDNHAQDLGIGWRMIVITVFLALMWFGLKNFAERIKTGKLEVPSFLQKGNKFFSGLAGWSKEVEAKHPQFNLEPVQRQVFPDGSELWVLENKGRYILLSKTLQSGVRYICDLSDPSAIHDADSVLQEAIRRL